MNIDIKLHKKDLPDHLKLGNVIAVDGEFMGLNVKRDPLCLVQISTGNFLMHILFSSTGLNMTLQILLKSLEMIKLKKNFSLWKS